MLRTIFTKRATTPALEINYSKYKIKPSESTNANGSYKRLEVLVHYRVSLVGTMDEHKKYYTLNVMINEVKETESALGSAHTLVHIMSCIDG